jgi:hypothetical protein
VDSGAGEDGFGGKMTAEHEKAFKEAWADYLEAGACMHERGAFKAGFFLAIERLLLSAGDRMIRKHESDCGFEGDL